MTQAQLDFDLAGAMQDRDTGLREVEANNQRFVERARQHARQIARVRGEVCADDVREVCEFDPLHPNAWGTIFRCPDFESTGRYRRSRLKQGHGNLQLIWRLKL